MSIAVIQNFFLSFRKYQKNFTTKHPTFTGCALFCSAMFLSVCISVFVKKTMVEYQLPAWEVIFIRQGAIVLMLVPFMIKFKFNFFNKQAIKPNLVRNVLYSISTFLFYSVLKQLSVNDCVSFQFFIPIFASIFATMIFGEKGSKMVWLALIMCFVGAFIIKRPDFANKNDLIVYALLFVFVLMRALINVLNGKLASNFSTSTLVFYTHIIMFLTSILFFWQFIVPHPVAVLILFVAGFMYCIEYILIYTSHKFCTVLTLQPCEFSKIVFSISLSHLVLGELTTINQIIGASFIMCGFLLMVLGKKHIEKKRLNIKPK